MSDPTGAARQRRYRLHRKGDHSECLAETCPALGAPVTVTPSRHVAVTPAGMAPATLGDAGRQLWADSSPAGWPADQLALLLQACRLVDRLDRLDAIVRGASDCWARFRVDDDSGTAVITIDKALGEERQITVALKLVLAELRQARGGAAAPAPPAAKGGGARGTGSVLDQLAARRAARLADSAGS